MSGARIAEGSGRPVSHVRQERGVCTSYAMDHIGVVFRIRSTSWSYGHSGKAADMR